MEVAVYRRRKNKAKTALIVVVDADTLAVEERLKQLAETLKKMDVPPLQDSESIARLVPKRNIETWILCLNSHSVDETSDYKAPHKDWRGLIATAAKALKEWTLRRASYLLH